MLFISEGSLKDLADQIRFLILRLLSRIKSLVQIRSHLIIHIIFESVVNKQDLQMDLLELLVQKFQVKLLKQYLLEQMLMSAQLEATL